MKTRVQAISSIPSSIFTRPEVGHLIFSPLILAISLIGLLLAPAPSLGASPTVGEPGEKKGEATPVEAPGIKAAQGNFGEPHPDAAPELAQFAFLIGHWACDVDFIGGDWQTRHQSTAEWTAYYIQGGRAIMDDFRGGFGEGYLATTIRVFDRHEKAWRGYWIDGQSGRWSRPLQGETTEDGMRLLTSMQVRSPEGEILDVDLQYEFHDIAADRFQWRQNSSLDGGETWRRESTRMACRRSAGPSSPK